MTRLSVNINKIATLRNARGENVPDVILAARRIQQWSADGITVHPRPDERHITYEDVRILREVVTTEYNIEGNPRHQPFVDLVLETRPEQVTLVPDSTQQLTSDHGWDTLTHRDYLRETIALFQKQGIRVSIFIDPEIELIKGAKETGTDRIELYTDAYAQGYTSDPDMAVEPYVAAAHTAHDLGLEINAGHALSLDNLAFFIQKVKNVAEVSIGHALISDALYLGLENAVQLYKRQLNTDE